LVLPSLWEGMPNAVLEAMAARRAVVATDVEGTAELVVPGGTGWRGPPGDPRAPALPPPGPPPHPQPPPRLGLAPRARVEAGFTPARVVLAYERLWAGLLGLELETAL